MHRTTLLFAMAFALALPAFAQTDADLAASIAEDHLDGMPLDPSNLASLTSPVRVTGRAIQRALPQLDAAENRSLARDYAKRRSDLQIGENANGGGSTSLVSKAGIPEWLAAAMENGAFAREGEGTVTTVRVGAMGLRQLFSRTECGLGTHCYDQFAAKGLSFYASLDRGSGNSVVPLATQSGGVTSTSAVGAVRPSGRLSGAGFKWEFLGRASDRALGKSMDAAIEKLVPAATTLVTAIAAVTDSAAVQQLQVRYREALGVRVASILAAAPPAGFRSLPKAAQDAAKAELSAKLEAASDAAFNEAYPGFEITPAIEAGLQAWAKAQADYNVLRERVLGKVLYATRGAVEMNYLNPASSPNRFTFRFAYTKEFGALKDSQESQVETKAQSIARLATEAAVRTKANAAGPLTTLSFNLAGSVYEHIPKETPVGRFRDLQAALQLDRKLGRENWEIRPTLSVAGYYQYMAQNGVIEFKQDSLVPNTNIPLPRPAVEVLNTKGSIWIGQVKLVIPLGGSGLSIPLSLSRANRTELIKASDIRGQFGLTLDLSQLLRTK